MLRKELLHELNNLFPNQIFDDRVLLEKHSGNQFYTTNFYPEAVCFPYSQEDVVKVTQFCIKHNIPIVPYGAGTSVEGHLAAVKGGVCLNFSRMKKILEFKPEDGYVTVEPGIAYNELNEFLEPYGYHFPVEAGWGASIGGMVSTNASGAGAVDSGSMSKNILSCNAVVYDENEIARVVKTGTKSVKSSAGYNLTSLFVGSEGTLGVITQITLKIRKNFDCNNTIACQFGNIDDAVNFVMAMKSKIHFRRVELLDKLQTNACIQYSSVPCFDKNLNTILIELAGNLLAVEEEKNTILSYLKENGAKNITHYSDKISAQEIWMMRKKACPAAIEYINKNKKAMATDISVPISELANCIRSCYSHMEEKGISAPLVAHIGDGNFHFTILIDPNNDSELKNAKEFNACLVEEALKLGGTCTGEHGVGLGKIDYLEREHGDSVFLMKAIKNSFDPKNIFNPGKIFSQENIYNKELKQGTGSKFHLFNLSPL